MSEHLGVVFFWEKLFASLFCRNLYSYSMPSFSMRRKRGFLMCSFLCSLDRGSTVTCRSGFGFLPTLIHLYLQLWPPSLGSSSLAAERDTGH